MNDFTITNCHIHLFNIEHVPQNFLPFGLMRLLRNPHVQRPLIRALRAGAWGRMGRRAARFAEVGGQRTQQEIFEVVSGYYPRGTRFVVLPMDMAFMKRGAPPKDIEAQHDELADLASKSDGAIIPFAAIDPRNPRALDELKRCRDMGFRGVKIYPPLGYPPSHEVLLKHIYPFCIENNLPVMGHCSRGGVRERDLSDQMQAQLAGPTAYRDVLKAFPELRVCLAHFGGNQDWNDYLGPPHRSPGKERDEFRRENWLAQILDMIRGGEYPNLWTDISYTAFDFEQNVPALSVFMSDHTVLNRVLFGSDFYMTEASGVSERRVAIELRHGIGDEKFRAISNVNPPRYLHGASATEYSSK